MKPFFLTILALFLAFPATAHAAEKKDQSVYDRVMESGTIRCGYFIWSPAIIKDPNTGALSGIFHDYVEELGAALDLKIEWTEEADFATYIQALNSGRYDMECSGGWPNAAKSKQVDFTTPIFFLPLYAYVRAGDTRFDHNLAAINDPAIRFATVDGETGSIIRQRRFPLTQNISLSQMMGFTMILQNVADGKADVALYNIVGARAFMANNPGTLQQVASAPLRVIPNNLTVPAGDDRFRRMIDITTKELLYDGVIDQILNRYEEKENAKHMLLRITKPYEVQE